jgi:hypothetical protein
MTQTILLILLIVIRRITDSFEVDEELDGLGSLHGITTEEDLLLSVCTSNEGTSVTNIMKVT